VICGLQPCLATRDLRDINSAHAFDLTAGFREHQVDVQSRINGLINATEEAQSRVAVQQARTVKQFMRRAGKSSAIRVRSNYRNGVSFQVVAGAVGNFSEN